MIMIPCLRKLLLMRYVKVFSITIISKTTSFFLSNILLFSNKSATSSILKNIWNRASMLWLLSSIYSWLVLYTSLLQLLHYILTSYNAFGQGGDSNLGDDTPGASCVSCICSKNHKLSTTDQATGSGGFHLLKQQELSKTQSGAQQRSHMFQQPRGSLRRNPNHRC
ncbi:unnamed protein product [Brassica oleracea var. botrytis]